MSEFYARIIVDVPVDNVDRIFDYIVPEAFKDRVEIGQIVKIPFGSRKIKGFIVGLSNQTSLEKSKLKEIMGIYKRESFFNEKQLHLFNWIADYYQANLINIIKMAVPTGITGGRVNKKLRIFFRINSKEEKKINRLLPEMIKKAPKQYEVLTLLLADEIDQPTASNIAEIADTSTSTVYTLEKKGFIERYYFEKNRRPFMEKNLDESIPFTPTAAQKEAIDSVCKDANRQKHAVFLLHGVTGSGKTEVYLQVIARVLEQGKGAIVLVPEISLTPVMVRRFYSRFGDKIAVLHSHLSLGERYDEWRRIKEGKAKIVVGARSAIFAPVHNPGVIIIDEEHENSYKQGSYPYYHAREVAIKKGQLYNIPVLLGSATPSVESFYSAQIGEFKYLALPERINKINLPPVEIVDMRDELKDGNISIFSRSLQQGIKKALTAGEQVLLFLNRRGYSSFVLCRECGHVIKCSNCDISLTYHAEIKRLRCHYCDFTRRIPRKCPECGSKYIKDFGIGTQRIEEEAKKMFPGASVERMDVDTTTTRGSHQRILKRVESGKTDILVGTQMIAKGHDYPNIAMVGVITADTILNLPDFRSSERTFQLLTQVAGRTGRGQKKGRVIIQTYQPDDYSIRAAREHDYQQFFDREIVLREKLKYPPFVGLVNIIIKGKDETMVIKIARKLGYFLAKKMEIIGPSPAPVARIRKNYRWQIILKFSSEIKKDNVLSLLAKWENKNRNNKINLNIDVDPATML